MKLTTYARTLHDISLLKELGYEEVILEPKSLSRFGKLSLDEVISFASRAKELKLRVLLEWDILMTENVFEKKLADLNKVINHVDAVRVQDPGAFHWMIAQEKPFQFIAENGNHNLEALQGWCDLASGKLERLILSIELSKDTIVEYATKLKVPCELLGFGRILLFYTPRPLLSALAPEKFSQNEELAVLGESEESPHKGFPIVENQHGTFMFHIKEFCLVDYADELRESGLSFFRIDQRWEMPSKLTDVTKLCLNFSQEGFEELKDNYSQDLMRGFFLVNKTDVLFPKLKNSRLQKREGDYIGEVLEAEKGSHLAIMIKNPKGLRISDELKILHPKGEIFEAKIYSLKNIAMEDVNEIPVGELALIQFVGGVWVKSQVFYRT